jgi:UDP-N-acetylmuramate--alanine ligase
VLLEQGYKVTGSDLRDSPALQRLARLGAKTMIGHVEQNSQDADVVVTSSAVDKNNPEVAAARKNKIPVVPRAEMLGELMRFRQGIAIAGTHGKTTTTSLVSSVLIKAGLDPTFVIGGIVNSVDSNARLGQGEILVAEADESDASFLQLTPTIAAVTNIDYDHMQTYENSFAKLKRTFVQFLHKLPFYGLAILCFDDPVVREVAQKINRRILSYGFDDDVDIQAANFRQDGHISHFDVVRHGINVGQFSLAMPGKHNVLNALVAIAIASKLGVKDQDVRDALLEFKGIVRRFSILGDAVFSDTKRALVVDDYAHHPRELSATFEAAKDCWPDRNIITLFQPHRYSRTQELFDDFAKVLGEQENLILLEVYGAGETPRVGADGRALANAIRARGGQVVFVENFEEASSIIAHQIKQNDVLLCLGAGDIGRYAQSLIAESSHV